MTEHEQRIEELIHTKPKIERTRWQKFLLVLQVLAGVVAFVSLAGVAVVGVRGNGLASCVNSITGDQNPVSARDAQAHVEWAKSLAHVLAADKAHVQAAYVEFVRDTNTYLRVLTEDQQYRNDHPLGRC